MGIGHCHGTRLGSEKPRDAIWLLFLMQANQFFGWLAGFGEQVKLVGECPMDDGKDAAEEFKTYLNKLREIYP